MQVSMQLKEWKIEKDDETLQPIVRGEYELKMDGGKVVASESFNSRYSSGLKVPFSPALMTEIGNLQTKMVEELNAILK